MGLVYMTSKWSDKLWEEHLASSLSGRMAVAEGIHKQGDSFAGFPADLHARLYLPTEPALQINPPEWAMKLHEGCGELGEWHQLKTMTARNGFAAGIAAEVMLQQLLPDVPEREEKSGNGGSDGSDDDNNNNQKGDENTNDADMRAALRRAARHARDAVADAEEAIEGLGAGAGVGESGRTNLNAIRDAHAQLKNSPMLKKVAKLAGRFERIAASKARSKVSPGVGELHGITMGDEIARLLPSELVSLTRPVLKKLLMAKLSEKRAMTYAVRGKEPCGRGPIVILLDESGSMRDDDRDAWSKAVALSVTNRAMKENRAVHIVGFTGHLRGEVLIEPGRGSVALIQQALGRRCSGGTDIGAAMNRACDIIKKEKLMRKADVLLITDGENRVHETTIERARALTASEGVSWFCVGIGYDAVQVVPETLGTVATSIHLVSHTSDGAPADLINLHRKEAI